MSKYKKVVQEIIVVLMVVFVIRSFVFEPFKIPTGSMIPNLNIGDHLFVSKYAYGYNRFSITFDIPILPKTFFYEQPKRGDIVVFKTEPYGDAFIKRLIGLPGDVVQMIEGVIYINGEALEQRYLADCDEPIINSDNRFCQIFIESMGDKSYKVRRTSRNLSEFPNTTAAYKVPDDHLFFLGDNRDSSLDSRFTKGIGFVPTANLVGRAEIIFFNVNRIFDLDFSDIFRKIT